MKPGIATTRRLGGFTGWDLLIVVVTVALLVAFILPALARKKGKAGRINCVGQLKQVGLAFRMWSNDHGEKFPFQVSTNSGGTLEFATGTDVSVHFRAISNELNTPKVLACGADSNRTSAISFDRLNDRKHLSYFIGLDSNETEPQTILSGDRSISTNGQVLRGIVRLATNESVTWAKGFHAGAGNIGFGDGSAQQIVDGTPLASYGAFSNSTIQLVIPAP